MAPTSPPREAAAELAARDVPSGADVLMTGLPPPVPVGSLEPTSAPSDARNSLLVSSNPPQSASQAHSPTHWAGEGDDDSSRLLNRAHRSHDGVEASSAAATISSQSCSPTATDASVSSPPSASPAAAVALRATASAKRRTAVAAAAAAGPLARACVVVCSPVAGVAAWVGELGEAVGWGVVGMSTVVYGLSQGYAQAMAQLALSYYWKDVLHVEPAAAQLYAGWSIIPWDFKPLYGMVVDSFPIGGYQHRYYLAACGVLGMLCWWALWLAGASLSALSAAAVLVAVSFFNAVPDVVVDGLLAQKIREQPKYAGDLQTLPWGAKSLISFLTFCTSGAVLAAVGPTTTFLFISLAPAALAVAALTLHEPRLPPEKSQPRMRDLARTWGLFTHALREPALIRTSVFLFLMQGAAFPDIDSGMFFWLTSKEHGPGFDELFMGVLSAVGQVGTLVGVVVYNRCFKHYDYRWLLVVSQLLLVCTGLLDLVLVTRLNRTLGIPDHAFVLGDSAFSKGIARLHMMPILVLAALACPPGVEATLFAFYMSVCNCGRTVAEWWGALLLHVVGVRRDEFGGLWLAVLIRSLARALPLLALPLLPAWQSPHADRPAVLVVEGDDEEEGTTLLKEQSSDGERHVGFGKGRASVAQAAAKQGDENDIKQSKDASANLEGVEMGSIKEGRGNMQHSLN